MATKAEELSNPTSTFNKAQPDEPLFILRPKDVLALPLINFWISLAMMMKQLHRLGDLKSDIPDRKLDEAIRLRDNVITYRDTHHGEVHVPD